MQTDFVHKPGATTLVVVFHGIGAVMKRLAGVRAAIEDSFGGDADVLMPKWWNGWFTNKDPVAITREAIERVDGLVTRYDYARIIVVGYSAGGIFARKFVVYANREEDDAPFEETARALRNGRHWADRIERVVLMAGMNRGWDFAPTANRFVVAFSWAAYVFWRMLGFLQLAAAMRRGAPFIADLRNQWLSLSRKGKLKKLIVVQLLGTIDDVVSPEDSIDAETGGDFYYLDVDRTGHRDVVDFSEAHRREVFVAALRDDEARLRQRQVPPLPPGYKIDESVKHVLFVIHGIRDRGFWTAHIARRVLAAAPEDARMFALTPSYGFFAMLPFIIPSTRRAKIRWFMDRYTEARARFPNATRFSYIGHSNGTYLLAGALRMYRTCRFDRVVFAGSVVRSDFDWEHFIREGRVTAVLNYVAHADWVVALFPRFLAWLRADVGGAGWDGFTPDDPEPDAPVNDVEYVEGGHSAALGENHWPDIARFVLGPVEAMPRRMKPQHSRFVWVLATLSPLIWLLLLGLIFLPPLYLLTPWLKASEVEWWNVPKWSLGARTFGAFLWIMLMRAVLTRM